MKVEIVPVIILFGWVATISNSAEPSLPSQDLVPPRLPLNVEGLNRLRNIVELFNENDEKDFSETFSVIGFLDESAFKLMVQAKREADPFKSSNNALNSRACLLRIENTDDPLAKVLISSIPIPKELEALLVTVVYGFLLRTSYSSFLDSLTFSDEFVLISYGAFQGATKAPRKNSNLGTFLKGLSKLAYATKNPDGANYLPEITALVEGVRDSVQPKDDAWSVVIKNPFAADSLVRDTDVFFDFDEFMLKK